MIAHRSLLLGLALLGVAGAAQADPYRLPRADASTPTSLVHRPATTSAPLLIVNKQALTPEPHQRVPVLHELKLLPPTTDSSYDNDDSSPAATNRRGVVGNSAKGVVSFVSPPPASPSRSDYVARVDRILEQLRASSDVDTAETPSPTPPGNVAPKTVVTQPRPKPQIQMPVAVAGTPPQGERASKTRRVGGRSTRTKIRSTSKPQAPGAPPVAAADKAAKSKDSAGSRLSSLLPWLKSNSRDTSEEASDRPSDGNDLDDVTQPAAMAWAESGGESSNQTPAAMGANSGAEPQSFAADRESAHALRSPPLASGAPIDLKIPAAAAATTEIMAPSASKHPPQQVAEASSDAQFAPREAPRQTTSVAASTVEAAAAPAEKLASSPPPPPTEPVAEAAPETEADSKTSPPPLQMMASTSPRLDAALQTASSIEGVDADATTEGVVPAAAPFPQRPKIYFRPAVADVNRYGQPVLRPEARIASRPTDPPATIPGQTIAEQIPMSEGAPLPETLGEPEIPEAWAAPIVGCPSGECGAGPCNACGPPPRLGPCQELCCRTRARLNGPCSPEPGIGSERVMHAISFIDTTQPQNNFRIRFDNAYDYNSPDRAEYFWAKVGGRGPTNGAPVPPGPPGEFNVDYQDIRFFMELGGKKFSVGTDIPIRVIDPDTYANTSGLGDINIITKTVFIDGSEWQITQLLRTYIPSGDALAGLGTGHASIEPGFAFRYKYSDITYFHADLKYWIPLAGDATHAGEVLNYGFGISHVWRQTDSFAVMPTLELIGYSFLDGQVTMPGTTTQVDVDPEGIMTINPGVRWVWDNGGDLGLKEFGIFGGFSPTNQSVYEELLRAELRFIW